MPESKLYRYPGIRAFEPHERSLFFGRTQETKELHDLIKVERLSILFAKSGIGKSSLLNAGVIPKLEKGIFHVIKVRFQDVSIQPADLLRKAVEDFAREVRLLQAAKKRLQEHCQDRKPLLWEELKSYNFEKELAIVPVLVFDQFEEFFMHSREHQQEFIECLADVVYERVPKIQSQSAAVGSEFDDFFGNLEMGNTDPNEAYWREPINWKIVMAIRSDRLSFLDNLSEYIPAILNNRYQLLPLDRERAKEAIVAPAALNEKRFHTPPFAYEPQALQSILDNLSNEKNEIESFQLQIVCRHVEQIVFQDKPSGKITIPASYLGGKEGIQDILNGYYERSIQKLGTQQEQLQVRQLIEEGMIVGGARVGLAEAILLNQYKLSPALLDRLLETRLIRIENTHLGKSYEVAHDTLVEPILESYEKRAEKERLIAERQAALQAQEQQAKLKKRLQRQRRIIAAFVVMGIIMFVVVIFAFIQWTRAKNLYTDTIQEQFRQSYKQAVALHFLENEYDEALISYNTALTNAMNLGLRDSIQKIKSYMDFCQKILPEKEKIYKVLTKADMLREGGHLDSAMFVYGDALDLKFNTKRIWEIIEAHNSNVQALIKRNLNRASDFYRNPEYRNMGKSLVLYTERLCGEMYRIHKDILDFYNRNQRWCEIAYQERSEGAKNFEREWQEIAENENIYKQLLEKEIQPALQQYNLSLQNTREKDTNKKQPSNNTEKEDPPVIRNHEGID